MSVEIVPMQQAHLGDAARLFVARHVLQRERVPALPERYGDPSQTLPLLQGLQRKSPGVVALRDGQPVGYLHSIYRPIYNNCRYTYNYCRFLTSSISM